MAASASRGLLGVLVTLGALTACDGGRQTTPVNQTRLTGRWIEVRSETDPGLPNRVRPREDLPSEYRVLSFEGDRFRLFMADEDGDERTSLGSIEGTWQTTDGQVQFTIESNTLEFQGFGPKRSRGPRVRPSGSGDVDRLGITQENDEYVVYRPLD